MRPSRSLFRQGIGVVLFTRQNCSLCDTAKRVVKAVKRSRDFQYLEIDVMSDGNKQWRDLYEFDTPVLHVQKMPHKNNDYVQVGQDSVTQECSKLWHRFTAQSVMTLIDSQRST